MKLDPKRRQVDLPADLTTHNQGAPPNPKPTSKVAADGFVLGRRPEAFTEPAQRLDAGGVKGALPGLVHLPAASKAEVVASAQGHGVTTNPAHYGRVASDEIDDNYLLNGMEAGVRFSKWLEGLGGGPVDVDAMMTAFEGMHRVAAVGENGQRPYRGFNKRMLDMYRPGHLRSDDAASRLAGVRPDAVRYTDQILGELGLERRPDGAVTVPGGPDGKAAGQLRREGKTYIYPLGGQDNLRPYFALAADKLGAVLSGAVKGEAALEAVGQYYHALINAKPFEQINNSLLMGHVNRLLVGLGVEPVSHGYIDHIAYRTDQATFAKVFTAFVEGRVRPAEDYGMKLTG